PHLHHGGHEHARENAGHEEDDDEFDETEAAPEAGTPRLHRWLGCSAAATVACDRQIGRVFRHTVSHCKPRPAAFMATPPSGTASITRSVNSVSHPVADFVVESSHFSGFDLC